MPITVNGLFSHMLSVVFRLRYVLIQLNNICKRNRCRGRYNNAAQNETKKETRIT